MSVLDWFRGRRRQEEPPQEWWQRLSRLEHDMEQLELSWEETYGKVRRALATLAKRQQRESGDDETDHESNPVVRQSSGPMSVLEAKRLLGR